MLSIKADKLRKLITEDETFPRPIKDGQNRQSAVYFDFNAICKILDKTTTHSCSYHTSHSCSCYTTIIKIKGRML